MIKLLIFLKFFDFNELILFFKIFFNFLKIEIKEIYIWIKSFLFQFFFKKKLTIKRIFALFIGWSFMIIPIILIIALVYKIFIVVFLKMILFFVDYYKI